MNLWKYIPTLMALIAIWSSADLDKDGVIEADETAQAIARSVTQAAKVIPGIKLEGKLQTEEGRMAFGEELAALCESYMKG